MTTVNDITHSVMYSQAGRGVVHHCPSLPSAAASDRAAAAAAAAQAYMVALAAEMTVLPSVDVGSGDSSSDRSTMYSTIMTRSWEIKNQN
jgi:hypothetical protein